MSSGGGGNPVTNTLAATATGGASLLAPGMGGGGVSTTLQDLGDIITGAGVAREQGRIAQAQLDEQRRTRAQALEASTPSPQELMQLQSSIALNEQDIARKQKLLDSVSPALIEAGRQTLALLKGRESAALNPLKQDIASQRKNLETKLKAQLGTGYANTSAGIQALAAFDRQANTALGSAQQQSLANLMGVTQNTAQMSSVQPNIANAGTFANIYGNQSARRANAILGTPITGAGAQFVTDLQAARGAQSLLNQGLQSGTALLTSGASGGAASKIGNTGGGVGANSAY